MRAPERERLRGLGAAGVGALLFAVLLGGAIAQLDALHATRARMTARGEPLYLPSPTVLRLASVGHETTVADLMYLWSIQYFGDRVSRTDRPWIARVYELITDLDPHFRDAYWLGFVSLLVEAKDPETAFRLADKALDHEPGFTLMAVEAALTARRLGDRERALRYLRRAEEASGEPRIRRLLLRLGGADTAQQELAEWAELAASDDALTRAIARAHVRDLENHVASVRLEALVACFERERGRPPLDLEELVRAGYLLELPTDRDGESFTYDRAARKVAPSKPYRFQPPTHAPGGVDLSDLGRCAPPRSEAASPPEAPGGP